MDKTPLFFTGNNVDRCSEIRLNKEALEALHHSKDARYLLLRRGRVRSESGCIAWQCLQDLAALNVDVSTSVFLGLCEGQPRFAIIPHEAPLTVDDRFINTTDSDGFVGLRKAAASMPPTDVQLAGQAVHLSNWINRNRFCGSCASPMKIAEGGYKLICENTSCAREEFPRTDPVIMALVTYGDRCLLARQTKFPPKFYAPLAGFVEPGETLEAAVHREVREEVGVTIRNAIYITSQPWPFPTSIMVGYLVEASDDKFVLDKKELEDGRWFGRAEIEEIVSAATSPEAGKLFLPPRGVLGRQLIDRWLSVAS